VSLLGVASIVMALPNHGTGHTVFVWTVVGGFWVLAGLVLWFLYHLPRD
jgi:hypothetical protein